MLSLDDPGEIASRKAGRPPIDAVVEKLATEVGFVCMLVVGE